MNSECLFCKIVEGTIPSTIHYRDEQCVVFNDIHPKARVHLLFVPIKHIPTLMDLEEGDEALVGHMARVANQLAREKGLEGYRLMANVGAKGGQEVFHLHFHLLGD